MPVNRDTHLEYESPLDLYLVMNVMTFGWYRGA